MDSLKLSLVRMWFGAFFWIFLQPILASGAVLFPAQQDVFLVAPGEWNAESPTIGHVASYLKRVVGADLRLVHSMQDVPGSFPAIDLQLSGTDEISGESFRLFVSREAGRAVVRVAASSTKGLKRGLQRLLWSSRQIEKGWEVPDLQIEESPWIKEREWTLCPWVPSKVRGAFTNPFADRRLNIWLYGEEQLSRYVQMFDWFGFSGAQLMETSYSYGFFGSPEAFQDRQKLLAHLVKENGQSVSLWVWAAQFEGFDWTDPEVRYEPQEGRSAFEDPVVRASFEKYYDHYARLAPWVDRVIGHFYDPGQLEDPQDVFLYMKLLESKFKEKNSDVKMAIDSWARGPEYLEELVGQGLDDYLLLEISMPHLLPASERRALHRRARELDLQLGVWGWYTTEYETDQLASMHVNALVLKDVYSEIRESASEVHPLTYWSEMDAHHLNNIYSMYVSSRLLWNPEQDPHEILAELAEAVWGPNNGPVVFSALRLIEDLRSGPRWETYWWTQPEYRLGTEDPLHDLRRCLRAIQAIEEMEEDRNFVPKIPLPVSPEALAELMLPHLRQMAKYAEFRIAFEAIEEAESLGATRTELAAMIRDAWKPIPEYDTWIGTFGQPEARLQERRIREFCRKHGIAMETPRWMVSRDADRLLEKIQTLQGLQRTVFHFQSADLNEFHWPEEKLERRFERLLSDGWIEKADEKHYRLANWRNYAVD